MVARAEDDTRIQFTDQSFSVPGPVIMLKILSKEEIFNFTKSPNRIKNVRDKIRLLRREDQEKSRKKKQQRWLQDGRKKLHEMKKFLECNYGSDDGIFSDQIIKPKFRSLPDIDRDNFSETSSVSGSSGSDSRPRRLSIVPQRFIFEKKSPKPKVQPKKVEVDPEASYEVEAIRDMSLILNEVFVRVKWENYPEKDNTWEPLENMKDCEVLKDFLSYEFEGQDEAIRESQNQLLDEHKAELEAYYLRPKADIMQELRSFDLLVFKCYTVVYMAVKDQKNFYQNFRKKYRHMVILNVFHELDITQYEKQREIIKQILEHENYRFTVSIVNDVDFGVLEPFTYYRENLYPPGLTVDVESIHGCNCDDGCSRTSNCCPTTRKEKMAYKLVSGKSRLRINRLQMIYECNKHCACDANCLNRVTQQPRLFPLQIFKTTDGRGWGLKTQANIPKGMFLMEYTGEIIDQTESVRRGKLYDQIGRSYMFDLDFNDRSEAVYTVDAYKAGNLSRFINHSCDPNCRIWTVTNCNQNPLVYKLCFFSTQMIKAGEELTFDYSGGPVVGDEDENDDKFENNEEVGGVAGNNVTSRCKTYDACKCGAENCRGNIFN